jgi:TldD protein
MGIIEGFDPKKIIKAALKRGGEFCDIYLEDTSNTSIVCEEDKVEKVVTGRDRGCGIRVISNLKTFYAYTNDLTEKGLIELAGVVSAAVKEGKPTGVIGIQKKGIQKKEVAPRPEIKKFPGDAGLNEKIALVNAGNSAARKFDKRVKQVMVVYGDGFNLRLPGRNPGG